VAGARDDDVVWDPFVGSGSELIERARLGPFRALFGSDLDPRALEAARANLAAAGVLATRLREGDALELAPPAGLSLVVTNPPLGRRVRRDAALKQTLARFVERVGEALAPGGRLVWIAPHAYVARETAKKAGLELVRSLEVDMGGFTCELQRFDAAGV
jgi:tRNA G10  N-methylase Trm11